MNFQNIYYNKYLKYKQKYLMLKGGRHSDLNIKYDDFINILKMNLHNNVWVSNFNDYHKKNIEKFDKLIIQQIQKTNNNLDIDKKMRIETSSKFSEDITLDRELKEAYKNSINQGTQIPIKDFIDSISLVEIYKNKKNQYKSIEFPNESNFNIYLQDFIEECNKYKTNPALNEFMCELIEFMIAIFNGNNIAPPFNIIITGSPGIGKSYVANIISNIMKKSLLLPNCNLRNIKKPDVIGQHIGTTAPKTYSTFVNALTNVIFIDEAYSFAGKKKQDGLYDQFGVEFLDALTDFITEHIGLIIIIVAGYKKEMKTQFLDVNIGLDRRFSVKINLNRYTTKFLCEEFDKQLVELANLTIIEDYNEEIKKQIHQVIYFLDLQLNKKIADNINYCFVNSDIFDNSSYTKEQLLSYCNKKLSDFEESIITNCDTILNAYLLSKCGVEYGDLFKNQYADIIKMTSIVISIWTNILSQKNISSNTQLTQEDTMYLCKSLLISYIQYKTSLEIEKDFKIILADYTFFVIFKTDFIYELSNILEYIDEIINIKNNNENAFLQFDNKNLISIYKHIETIQL
jgi:hypothetical protein